MKMIAQWAVGLALGVGLCGATMQTAEAALPTKFNPGHYMSVYTNGPNGTNVFEDILDHPNIEGVQKSYRWDLLEPRKGVYDFSQIEADLFWLQLRGKRLVIQVLDSWTQPVVPLYLRTPEYGGGYYTSAASVTNGCCTVAKRWNPAVVGRIRALLYQLGARFDKEPFVEAINMEETATGLTVSEYAATGYTPEKQRDAHKAIMSAGKAAFPNTLFIQYVNFIAGNGSAYIEDLMRHATRIGVGYGSTGARVDRAFNDVSHFPPYLRNDINTRQSVRVEVFDYDVNERPNLITGQASTPAQFIERARQLKTEYIFWHRTQPYWLDQVIPALDVLPAFP